MTSTSTVSTDWRARLRDAGLRVTRPRLAVLELLQAIQGPRSHGEVVDALGEPGWDRATLFRNLNDLAAAGLLRRFDLGDHVWRFELVPEPHAETNHAHFVCVDCGVVRCVEGIELRAAGDQGHLLRGDVEIQIRGSCGACA